MSFPLHLSNFNPDLIAKKSSIERELNKASSNKGNKAEENINIPAFKGEDLKLPKKFAEQVLELEMGIEQSDFTLKQLQRLMSLYSKAVEFYSGKSDTKYFYYNDKIQNLLTQPKVLDMLSEKIENTKKQDPVVKPEPDVKTKETMKKKERIMKMNLHITNQETEKQDLKAKIIEDHVCQQDQESRIIQSNLSEQSENLRKRLEMRKKSRVETQGSTTLTTTSSTPNIMLSSHKDKLENNEGQNKSSSSGAESVDDNFSFHLNFDHLGDEKFSDELMNRLTLLQEGFDDDDFDDDLFNEDEETNANDTKIYNE